MRATILFLAVTIPLLLTGIANAQLESDQPDHPRRDPEMRQRMIEEFDADGDGKLNDEERQEARATMRERRGGPDGQGRPGRGGPQGRRGAGGDRPDPSELFDKFDANGDGQLSREEFMELTHALHQRRGGPGGPGGPRADRGPRPGPPEGADRPRRRPEGDGPPPRRGDSDRPRLRDEGDRGPLQNQLDGPPREERGPRFGPGGPEGRPDPNEIFDRFDEDGDNQLSREEFMKLTESIRQRMSERGRRPGGPRGEGFGPPDRDRPGRPARPPRPDSD